MDWQVEIERFHQNYISAERLTFSERGCDSLRLMFHKRVIKEIGSFVVPANTSTEPIKCIQSCPYIYVLVYVDILYTEQPYRK